MDNSNMVPLTVFIHPLDYDIFKMWLDQMFPHCSTCGARRAVGTDSCRNCEDALMGSLDIL
jgi:hypothetical protein